MASNAVRIALAVLLLHGASIAAQSSQRRGSEAATPSWALEVLTLESTSPTALWVGLINRSTDARLLCVFDRGISYSEKDGTLKVTGEGGSPHGCYGDDQFQLVRAGQTRFIRLPLPSALSARVSGRIRVEVGLVDRPTSGIWSRREPVGAAWEGTLLEAADLGRALKGHANKGR